MIRSIFALFGLAILALAPVLADSKPESPKAEAPKPKPPEAKKPIERTGPKKLFPVRIEDGDRTLHLNGWGLCEWGIFNWDLYYAALHCEHKSKSAKALLANDQAYDIRLHFLRDLTRDQMRKAYRAGVEVNAGDDLPKFRKRLDQLLRLMRAVDEGDDLYFRYRPGKGLSVAFGDTVAGTIEGADWARLFLAIYVGENAPTDDLRRGLLGR